MNKGELVNLVAEQASIAKKKEVDIVISAALNVIMDAVANDEKVTLIGFGTFEARKRAERTGRNPQTGETITIPASVIPAFSAGKAFKEKLISAD